MLANIIRLAFLLPLVPPMILLAQLFGERAVPQSFVDDLDITWSMVFGEE